MVNHSGERLPKTLTLIYHGNIKVYIFENIYCIKGLKAYSLKQKGTQLSHMYSKKYTCRTNAQKLIAYLSISTNAKLSQSLKICTKPFTGNNILDNKFAFNFVFKIL